MSQDRAPTAQDLAIRHHVYQFFADHARPPCAEESADRFGLSLDQARAAYQTLHDSHLLFLDPGTTNVRMANPFSAIPTDFVVETSSRSYYANCAWDLLGIPAMLGCDATLRALTSDTSEEVTLAVVDGHVNHSGGIVHFPLPISQWYDDLILT